MNFKIIHRILATPAVVSKVRHSASLANCHWCGTYANIDHILLECSHTNDLYCWVQEHLDLQIDPIDRVFGINQSSALVIWVVNFAVYKVHLMALDGHCVQLLSVLKDLVQLFGEEYNCLSGLEF